MGNDLQIAIGAIGFFAVLLSPFVINKVLKYKVEISKIRAQMEIEKEEIRARNQLEIEKLMLGDPKYSKGKSGDASENIKKRFEESGENLPDDRTDRERLRY